MQPQVEHGEPIGEQRLQSETEDGPAVQAEELPHQLKPPAFES